jgi:hypothetical protein
VSTGYIANVNCGWGRQRIRCAAAIGGDPPVCKRIFLSQNHLLTGITIEDRDVLGDPTSQLMKISHGPSSPRPV